MCSMIHIMKHAVFHHESDSSNFLLMSGNWWVEKSTQAVDLIRSSWSIQFHLSLSVLPGSTMIHPMKDGYQLPIRNNYASTILHNDALGELYCPVYHRLNIPPHPFVAHPPLMTLLLTWRLYLENADCTLKRKTLKKEDCTLIHPSQVNLSLSILPGSTIIPSYYPEHEFLSRAGMGQPRHEFLTLFLPQSVRHSQFTFSSPSAVRSHLPYHTGTTPETSTHYVSGAWSSTGAL